MEQPPQPPTSKSRILLTPSTTPRRTDPLRGLIHDANGQLGVVLMNLEYIQREYSLTSLDTALSTVQQIRTQLELIARGIKDGGLGRHLYIQEIARLRERILPVLPMIKPIQHIDSEVFSDIYSSATAFNKLMDQGGNFAYASVTETSVEANLADYLREVVGSYQRRYPEIDLTFEIEGEHQALFYPMALRRALENLINNAIQALPDGKGAVGIKLTRMLVDAQSKPFEDIIEGPYLAIEISDTGIGFPQEVMECLPRCCITTKPYGSGVGLESAGEMLRAHHGHLMVETESGRGTRVTALLPSTLPPPPAIHSGKVRSDN